MVRLLISVFAVLIATTLTAAADDFPTGPGRDLVMKACDECHDADVVTSQHETAEQWSQTVRQMISNGAHVPDADFEKVVAYLAQNFGAPAEGAPTTDSRRPALTPAQRAQRAQQQAEAEQSFASYQTIEGQPIQVHPAELPTETPAFPGQTRAVYQRTAPFNVTTLTDKLRNPWSFAFLPDGNILISERLPGTLLILNKQGVLSAPVSGLAAISRVPDFALLDVELDPHFTKNHLIFFTFFEVVTTGPGRRSTGSNTYVARARFDEAAGALTDVQVIFRTIPAVPTERLGLKTGGRIAFGPDGNLFVSIGDRNDNGVHPWDVAQHLDTDLGKIIHITPDGKPAPDNPFVTTPGALPEIWAYGIRSPEGLTFDPKTGELWETEHGPRGGDELNIIKKGANYGWPVISYGIDYSGKPIENEGAQKAGMEQPVYFWDPVIAPSGLAFYKGDLFPDWKNSIFAGGLRGMVLVRLTLQNDKVVGEEPLLTNLHAEIRDVRVGPDGAVYVLTQASGDSSVLVKLTPK